MSKARARKSPKSEPNVAEHLEQVRVALAGGDDAAALGTALGAALAAWRMCRVPRLADMVDRISARLVRPAIPGATVSARTQAWRAIAKERDPADVPRLLATPWPGMPKPAAMQLNILARLPADPRIAQALARELAEGRKHLQRHNVRFLSDLIDRVVALGDTRVLDTLHSEWRLHENRWALRAAEGLRGVTVPELAADAAATVAALETLVPEAVPEAAPAGDAMLAAIYADPDDLAARAVYGDWLLERGDPRGELIGLSLGAPNEASQRRCAQLIAAHGAEWVGPLDAVFEKTDRVFEHGFLAGGRLDVTIGPDGVLPAVFREPAWSTLRELDLPAGYKLRHGAIERLLDLPWAQRLRAIRGLEEPMALALLTGPPRPALRELGFYVIRDGTTLAREAVMAGRTLALERLSINADPGQIEWLLGAPLFGKLQRITFVGYRLPLGTWIANVIEHGHAIDTIAVEEPRYRDAPQWQLIARRDADGRYTRVHGASIGTSSVPAARKLVEALATFAADALTEFIIADVRACTYSERDIESVERELARFTRLATIRVPWDRAQPVEMAPGTVLQLYGVPLTARERLQPFIARLSEPPLALGFDGYSINRGAHRALDEDPVEAVVAAFARKQTRDVALYRKGASQTCRLEIERSSAGTMRLVVPLADDPAQAEAYLAWVERLLDTFPFTSGRVPFVAQPPQLVGKGAPWRRDIHLRWPYQRGFGWFTILDTPPAWLPHTVLAAIAARHPWVRVVHGRSRTALVLGESPHRPPAREPILAFEADVAAGVLEVARTQRDFDLFGVIDELVPAVAARDGYQPEPSSDPYARTFTIGHRTFRVGLVFDQGDPEIACTAVRRGEVRVFARTPINSLRDRVAQIATRLGDVAAWLAG